MGWIRGTPLLALCAFVCGCAPIQSSRELAGTGASLLPADRSIYQIYQTADEAAKAACTWLRKNEPKSERFEYCGFVIQVPEGFMATVPETMGRPSQCNRPADPPGVIVRGWYHSHRWTEEFSPTDKQHGLEIALYLCAPGGLVKKLTPEGTVIVK